MHNVDGYVMEYARWKYNKLILDYFTLGHTK